jgi:DNA (cytosine-5)-methyltransferase 1
MEVLGSIYTEVSDRFQKGIIEGGRISRCVKAEKHDLGVVFMEQINLDGSQRGLENGKWRTYTDIMPSITAREYKEPRSVMEVMQIGNISEEKNFRNPQTGRIYDVRGCSPTLSTMQGGNQEPKILESQIVAMRGRNPDNPSDRALGSLTEQRLEVNMQGTSNCLTSVQKDNLLLENVKIRQATKGGSIECEIGGCFDASYPNSKTRRGRVQDKGNTCPTLTAQNQEVVRIEKLGQISSNGSQCGTVVSDNGISANLVAGTHGYANSHIATQYRIRKLTPRECGRLMGVSDEDIDKMAAVNSNTQLYKQFGNSIVVDVMCAMFKNLNINQGDTV